jgi:hypothetical protein
MQTLNTCVVLLCETSINPPLSELSYPELIWLGEATFSEWFKFKYDSSNL